MDYLIAVPGPAYRLSDSSFATESAFAEHLLELRRAGEGRFDRVVLLAFDMQASTYQANKKGLRKLSSHRDGVVFVSAGPEADSTPGFWRHAPRLWRVARQSAARAAVVHTDVAYDIRKPMTAIVALAARLRRRPVVFVVDVDFRGDAKRNRAAGLSSTKRYMFERLLLEPFRSAQVWIAVRMCQLVLLKSASLVEDFGKGRPSVKNFYDTVHSDKEVLDAQGLQDRIAQSSPKASLELCYFGRLIDLKGCDRMIEAIRISRARGCDVHLTIIGDGPCEHELKAQVDSADLSKAVRFIPQVPYGNQLFDQISKMDITLAAPVVQETPRAAFDSLARGIPILAFDISYFRDLADASDAILLARWPSADDLADKIIETESNRDILPAMSANAVAFARDNTQQLWVSRRMSWTIAFALGDDQGMTSV